MKSPKVKRPVKYLAEWNRRFEQHCRDNPYTDIHCFDCSLEMGLMSKAEYLRIKRIIDSEGRYIMSYEGGI